MKLSVLTVPLQHAWGSTPLLGNIGIWDPKGYGFSAILVTNSLSILYSSLSNLGNLVYFLGEANFSDHKEGRKNRRFWF